MNNEKQLIRWERHYSDGSVEYTDKESTSNFESNLNSVGGLIAYRSYIQMKPVEWLESKAENLPISDVIHWVAVEDKLPPQKRVLIYMVLPNHSAIGIGGYDELNGWMSRGEKVPVTHWAELPEPPCG